MLVREMFASKPLSCSLGSFRRERRRRQRQMHRHRQHQQKGEMEIKTERVTESELMQEERDPANRLTDRRRKAG